MKHLKLFFACLLMAVLSIGQVWGAEVTYSLTPDATSTGSSATSYQASLSFTYEGVSWTMAQINPSTLQTKTNQTNPTAEFNFHNTSAFPGRITQVVVKYKALTIATGKQSEFMFLGGTSAVTATTEGTSGTWNSTDKTFTWTPAANTNYTYFAYYMNGKTATGSNFLAEANAIVVTYDDGQGGGSDPVAVTGVTLDKNEAEVAVGGTVSLTATVAPSNATTKTVTWESDDEDVATVDGGVVTGVAEGTATITVKTTDGNKTATCEVTVTAASPKITITQNEVADFAASYAEYTWTAGGVSGKMYAYKNAGMQFNSSKTGYYVYNTDPIPGRITKITMTKASGTDRSWTPYVSTTAMTSASGTALDAQTVTSTGVSWDVTGSNSYFYLTVAGGSTVIGSIVIEYTEDAPPAIDAPSISGDVNFVGSTTVTISHDDADHIYYTTNGVDPTTSSTEYTAPFVVNADGTTTVKAIAVKGSDVSEVASKGFTKVTALESLAALLEATTSSETAFNVVIDNWVVTGVNGNRAWIADAANEKGILLYKSGHGFTAGKKLNGVVLGTKTKLFQGYPEMTTLVSTDVTVTTAEAVSPRTTTIAALTSGHPAEQGTVVKLENVTYSSSVLSDGVNSIAADNKLFSSLALVDGTTYDITGVVEYLDGSVVKIMPRSADDVEAKSSVVIPTAANLAALKAAERGTYILTLTNAVVTYVNGNNAFIEDATGGALIYFASHGYSAGDCLNGDYQVVTTDYQGKFEITAMEPQAGAATTTAEIPLTTVSIATLNADFAAYESKRIKIAGANVTDAISGSDRNGAINDGAALAVYAAAGASTITLTADDNVDIIGYPGFHNTDQQLNVWTSGDITVNEKDPAGIAFTPESATHTPGVDEWSAPAFANPNTLDVTFSSDAEGVATVSNVGVVSLAGGYGTAVITAHTNGDATHNAGNATYTITVIDPSTVDTRHVANGPAAFTTTSGNLTPADIAYTAYQGGANTAPGIYNDGIRLYQISGSNDFGGFVTITAKAGCTIDEVQITTTSKYATTVAYSKDGNENLLGEESVAKSGAYTTGTGLNVSSVNILNLGTGSDGRLEIASITVYYTGEALTIDHYFLGGTYETTFEQNGTFDYTGLELYASYDAGETIIEEITDFTVVADLSVVGPATASVQVNSVEVTTYAITVTAGKEDPALAYTPASATITAGDAWSAPILSNTFSVSPITYSSDKESVATVTSEGVITLAGGYGTAVITAHFDETAAYIESEATYTITVNKPAPTPTTTVYRKVTATADITDGEYLIVYEGDATHSAAVFDGSLENVDQAMKALAVEIVSDEIAGNTDLDAATFTIDVTAGTLQSASGYYIGRETYDNGMDKSTETAYTNTFVISEGKAVITGAGNCTLRYNYASDQLRFRYYKSGQQAIQLYKKEAPKYSVTYAANGGSGDAPAAVEYEEGETFSVAAADLFTAPEGKEFDGWLCDIDAIKYAANAEYTMTAAATTFTAQWKQITYAVTYVSAHGTAPDAENAASVTLVELTEAGWTHTGWVANVDVEVDDATVTAGTPIANGKVVVLSAATEFTAQWIEDAPTPVYTEVRTGLTAGNYYTICYPKAMTDVQGATLWSFFGKDADFAYIVQETATTIEAGKPYILYATASTVTAVLGDETNAPGANGAIHGTFSDLTQDQLNNYATVAGNDLYLVIGNQLRKATGYANDGITPLTGNSLPANRAFVVLGDIPAAPAPAHMPAHVRRMPMQKDVATGFENLNASEKPVKLMIDGNIFILRGEKLYDATGRLVK